MDKIKNNLVYGVGKNDYKGRVSVKGKPIKSYQVWGSMIQRCYSSTYQKRCPTYIGCTVSNDWLSFSNFKDWFDSNYDDRLDFNYKLNLDKDLLVKGNKVYSPDTCVLLPAFANSFLTNKQSGNTSGATGVCWHRGCGKWVAKISINRKRKHLGYYNDVESARESYILARETESCKVKSMMLELGYSHKIVDLIK